MVKVLHSPKGGDKPATTRRDLLQRQLGEAVRRLRLERDIDQITVCEIAGISRGTLINLEQGRGATTATLVAVIDALGAADWIAALSPPEAVSPMALLRLKQEQERNRPRRASRKPS